MVEQDCELVCVVYVDEEREDWGVVISFYWQITKSFPFFFFYLSLSIFYVYFIL